MKLSRESLNEYSQSEPISPTQVKIVNLNDISFYRRPLFARCGGTSLAICSHGAHLSRERRSPLDDVGHRQHRKGAVGVLGQPLVAHFGKVPQAFEDDKGELKFGALSRLPMVGVLVSVSQGRMAVGALVCEVESQVVNNCVREKFCYRAVVKITVFLARVQLMLMKELHLAR